MDKKIIIIFALVAVTIIFLFMVLGSGKEITSLKQERNELKEENNTLNVKIQASLGASKQFEAKIASLSKDLENINAEKRNIQQRYEMLLEEKEILVDETKKLKNQLKELKEKESFVFTSKKPELPSSSLADAHWASVLKEKTALELRASNLDEEIKALKIANEQLQQDKKKVELEISLLSHDNQDFKRELEYNKKLVDNLAGELSREKTGRYQIQENLKTIKSKNRFLLQQLKVTDEHGNLLKTKIADLQSRNTVLESSLAKMETFIREKIMQMDSLKEELGLLGKEESGVERQTEAKSFSEKKEPKEYQKESVELQPIIVRPQEAQIQKTQISAKKGNILAVNKDNNFVIINLGENAGIKPGDGFGVYNARDELAASIEVIEVRKEISACDIKQENFSIEVGDTVR